MRNYNPLHDRTVIRCMHCLNKLRVPTDKGKISVACPVCRKEFIYNPNSIPVTLKQILLSVIARLPKTRRNQVILLIAALLVLIALFLVFSGMGRVRNREQTPGVLSYEMRQGI